MEATLNATKQKISGMQWLILATAGLGFAFDMYEMVIQSIVLRPFLMELGGYQPGTREFNHWAGIALFVPVMVGGLASLIGGYLTDRLGRRRVLVWSIVLYGSAAFMSGFSTSLAELIFWRCITIAGACVEFVAAIAWLTELFPDTRRRETVLGFSQATATIGNFMIAGAYYLAVTWGDRLPEVHGGHSAWRYALMFGALPALPLIILRPFLPESPVWESKRSAGTLRRPSFRELFAPRFRRITLLTTALVTCCYALAFGMLQHIPRIVPGLPGVANLPRLQQEVWVSFIHFHSDIGALIGRILLALLVTSVVVRGPILRWILLCGTVAFPLVFLGPALNDPNTFRYAVLVMTILIGMQWSFWGNYLPRVFPVHLRGTGESFAISFGGRVIAPLAAIATTQLANLVPGASPTARLATSMALVAGAASLCALLLAWRLPEPPAELPED